MINGKRLDKISVAYFFIGVALIGLLLSHLWLARFWEMVG